MSGKKEKQRSQDLSALENTYRIVGELSARENVREYLATRAEDGADVRILIEQAPQGDAGNALTLYAADINLLAGLEHRNLIRVHDGRWVAQDQFAVVTDRCQVPTLETLVSRGESWSYPRIATILHEVNGLLDWARQQKVVHRTFTPGTLHIEPGTDRVLVSFIAQPLTRQGAPGAEGDARTIAQLAWTLITRGRDLPQSMEDSLGIVRPELPRKVIETTDALMHGQRVGDTDPPTVPDFIATIAMTDAIMRGEVIAAEVEATVYQEQLLEREAWSAKERDYQEQIAERDRQMVDEREEMARTLANEREEMARTLENERTTLAQTLAAEREQMAGERAALEQQMADDRQRMGDERAALEQEIADERKRLAEEHEALVRELSSEREEVLDQLANERAELEARVTKERQALADDRVRLEREVAEERERLARDRTEFEAESARERAAMATTLADERAQTERRFADERARLEAEMAARREELESRIAADRAAFEREVFAERNALEADKENFAVFNAAEREAIEGERRALEELYLSYEAEGHVVVDAEDEVREDSANPAPDRPISMVTAALADYAPIAVPVPQSEPDAEPTEPAETEAGLMRTEAKRSRRAAWGVPASVILLVGIITATAVGVGADDDKGPREERPAAERQQPAATPAHPGQVAAPDAPTVIDSAGGTVVTPDSVAVAPAPLERPAAAPARQETGSSPPAHEVVTRQRRATRPVVDDRPATTQFRNFDTAVATPPARVEEPPTRPDAPQRAEPIGPPAPTQTPTFPPVIMPTATPGVTPPSRDTAPTNPAPANPAPALPPTAIPQPTVPTVPPTF